MSVPLATGRSWHLRLALVRALIGIFPSFTLNRTRLWALRACGIRIGSSTLFWGLPVLKGRGGSLASRLAIGSFCGLNEGCEFDLSAPVTIGNHVSVGHEVRFITTATVGKVRDTRLPITIGDGVWLGARRTITAGVTIGADSVSWRRTLPLTADVAPNTLVTGAKPISLARVGLTANFRNSKDRQPQP